MKNKQINSISDLARLHGARTLALLGKHFYDETECGVNTEFITGGGESHYYSDDHYGITQYLPNIWAGYSVVGICFHTIVEGSDAEFSADPVFFPCEYGEIEDALNYLEEVVRDYEMMEEEDEVSSF